MDEGIAFYILKAVLLSLIIFYFLQLIEFSLAIIVSWKRLYAKPARLDPEKGGHCPGISIIKPLMGLDPCLEENLESHFTLNYPSFELLFCFHSDTDPAINVVRNLGNKYPTVDYRIFTTEHYNVINPMIQNMLPAYDNAKYDLLWVSTSRINVTTDVLLDMVERTRPDNVGLVHQMPYISNPKREMSLTQHILQCVEKIYFGSCLARHFIVADFVGYGLFCGMSYMTKKSALQLIGGFEELGKFLAEDFFLEKLVHAKGFKTGLSTYPAQQNMLPTGLVAYKDRLVRWSRLRIQLAPLITLILEPLCNAISMAVFVSLALNHLFAVHPAVFVPIHLVVWFFLDVKLVSRVEGKRLGVSLFVFFCAWLVRELMVYYILFEAVLNPFTIKWGRGTYRVVFGGHTTKLHTPGPALNA